MQALIVVPAFDEVKDRVLGIRAGRPAVAVDQVLLERREEALGGSVVVTGTHPAHAGLDLVLAKLRTERQRSVLGGFQRTSQRRGGSGCAMDVVEQGDGHHWRDVLAGKRERLVVT